MEYEYSGFLSVGASRLNSTEVYLTDIDNDWGYDNDSVLGLQLKLLLSDNLDFTGQVIARGYASDDSDNYNPKLEWAYFSYKIQPGLIARIGRMGIPWYDRSDHLEIGMAYAWVRPPVDVYGPIQTPLRSFDGVDLLYKAEVSDGYLNAQLLFGHYDAETTLALLDSNFTLGGKVSFTRESLTLSYGIIQTEVNAYFPLLVELSDFVDSITDRYPDLSIVNTALTDNDADYLYQSVSVVWDHDDWQVQSEYFNIDSSDLFSVQNDGWYISVSRVYEYFTPYLVVGYSTNTMKSRLTEVTRDIVDRGPLIPDPANLGGLAVFGVDVVEDGLDKSQRTHAVGLRYDLSEKVAIKGEILKLSPLKGKSGHLTRYDPDTYVSNDVMVYSIVVDMIF